MKMEESSLNRLKTLWEKEKMLDTTNFSFSHSVFKRLVQQTRKNRSVSGKRLNKVYFSLSLQLWCLVLYSKSRRCINPLENIVERAEIAHFEQFHLFPQCFPKAFYLNVLKRVYMEERVKPLFARS